MEGEQEAIAPVELETPASETAAVETKEVPVELAHEQPEAETETTEEVEAQEPEFVTIERNGKSFQVPKELEGEFLMQSDYTKKTQGVSETVKQLESREAEINQRAEASEADLDNRAQLHTVKTQLAEYEKLTPADWQRALETDFVGTQQARLYYDSLKEQKAALEGKVIAAHTERTEKAQQSLAKRVQETFAEAPKVIPGWKPETGGQTIDKLVAFAHSQGIPEQVLKDNWSPALLKLLHRASLGEQSLQKPAAPTPKAPPAEAITPLATVGAKSAPAGRKSLAEMAKAGDMEGYAAARRAGRTR